MKEVKTNPGKWYAVTSASGCTVSLEDGTRLAEVQPGIQAVFCAVSGKTQVSDDAAIVTQTL